jgi:hypothetical protein
MLSGAGDNAQCGSNLPDRQRQWGQCQWRRRLAADHYGNFDAGGVGNRSSMTIKGSGDQTCSGVPALSWKMAGQTASTGYSSTLIINGSGDTGFSGNFSTVLWRTRCEKSAFVQRPF